MNLQLKFEQSIKKFIAEGEQYKILPSFIEFESVASVSKGFMTQSKSNFITGLLLLKNNRGLNLAPIEITEIINDSCFGEILSLDQLETLFLLQRDYGINLFEPQINKERLDSIVVPYFNQIKDDAALIKKEYVDWIFANKFHLFKYVPNFVDFIKLLSENFNSKSIDFLSNYNLCSSEELVSAFVKRTADLNEKGGIYDFETPLHFLLPELVDMYKTSKEIYIHSRTYSVGLVVLNSHRTKNTKFYQTLTKLNQKSIPIYISVFLGGRYYGNDYTLLLDFLDKHFDLSNIDQEFFDKLEKIAGARPDSYRFDVFREVLEQNDYQRFQMNLEGKFSTDDLLVIFEEAFPKEVENNPLQPESSDPFVNTEHFDLPF